MVTRMKMQRLLREITQVDLWLKTGIPQWRLSLIERGIKPKAEEEEKIARALGVEPEKLFHSDSAEQSSRFANLHARGAHETLAKGN
jgi:transcriptional regulator with XRE-family HTH domain